MMFTGKRPDIPPTHVAATFVAGVPIVSRLLAAFGVFHPSLAQQQALTDALNWGVPFAGLLIGGDVALRAARNHADAKVQAAALLPAPPTYVEPAALVGGNGSNGVGGNGPLVLPDEAGTLSEEEEFSQGAPPPESAAKPEWVSEPPGP